MCILAFAFLLVLFEFPRTMFAATLATIATFQMVLFSKDNITFWGKIVIFFVELIGEGHVANFVKLIDFLQDILFINCSLLHILWLK